MIVIKMSQAVNASAAVAVSTSATSEARSPTGTAQRRAEEVRARTGRIVANLQALHNGDLVGQQHGEGGLGQEAKFDSS